MALRPKTVDIDTALRGGQRITLYTTVDIKDALYGFAIEVEDGFDPKYGVADDGVLIFVPAITLDDFEKGAD